MPNSSPDIDHKCRTIGPIDMFLTDTMRQSTTAVRATMMNRGAATRCADARLDWFAEGQSRRLVRLAFTRLHNTDDATDAVLAPTTARCARLGVDRPGKRRRAATYLSQRALHRSKVARLCVVFNRIARRPQRCDDGVVTAVLWSPRSVSCSSARSTSCERQERRHDSCVVSTISSLWLVELAQLVSYTLVRIQWRNSCRFRSKAMYKGVFNNQ